MADSIPSIPLFPATDENAPYPPPNDWGCPVPGCPVPGPPIPPKPPHKAPPYPDPHDPGYFASEGDWPLPPQGGAGQGCTGQQRPGKECNEQPRAVPPPIPPVRYVPGMDVQEQLSNMATQVNTCINRWNEIQANCYEALNRVVGAAVSNDVYYEPDEVRLSSGFSSADGCAYHIIEARPVDKAGRPIRCQLLTAYNAGNPTVREPILQKSFVSSANAIITAVSPANQWSGLCITNGNPRATNTPKEGEWLCGWTKRGVLRLLPSTETTVASACRNQIVDCIGPVIPIVMNGKPTQVAADFSAEPGAIQAIGWKQCNGNKVLFSCGFNDEPGCSVKNVADLLVSMGVTTAAVTCYMSAYGAPQIGGFVKESKTDDNTSGETSNDGSNSGENSGYAPLNSNAAVENIVGSVENYSGSTGFDVPTWMAENDSLSGQENLGLTGGMAYIGTITEKPLEFQLPQNAAYWVITKRPNRAGWPNRWTGEIADICQRLGANATELASVQGKIDLEQMQILDLIKRVSKNEIDIKDLQNITVLHTSKIQSLENRMTSVEKDVEDLQTNLQLETDARIAADNAITDKLNQEINDRVDADNKMSNQINQIRTALTEEITARNQADQDLNNAIKNEMLARQAADLNLETQIELLKTSTNTALQKEINDRIAGDQNLQEQIDNLQKEVGKTYSAGKGINSTVEGDNTAFNVVPGPGVRINAANQVAVNPGIGLELVNGRVQVSISECFKFNEKGELEMSCCNSNGEPQVQAGVGLDYSADPETGKLSMNVQPPKNGDIGGVKAGAGVTITPDGTISANGGGGSDEPYELPPATDTTLGGVIVGENLTVDENGKINAPAPYELPIASPEKLGGVRVGTNLTIDSNGVLNAQIPDMPQREGDTVLAGEGINVVKNGEEGTATVNLNEETQNTLTQVGENKTAIDAIKDDVRKLSTNKADRTELATLGSGIDAANQEISNLQTQVDGHTQSIADASEAAATAQVTAEGAQSAASAAANVAAKALPKSGGTMTGNIDFTQAVSTAAVGGAPTVTGLPTPTEDTDAATKAYVDAKIGDVDLSAIEAEVADAKSTAVSANATATNAASAASQAQTTATAAQSAANAAQSTANNALPKTGGTMTGAIVLPGSPTADLQAATKKYVDDAVAGAGSEGDFLPVSGGTMTGPLVMGKASGQSNAIQLSYPFTDTQDDVVVFNITGGNSSSSSPRTISITASEGAAVPSGLHPVLRGIHDPIQNADAATKNYVSTQSITVNNISITTGSISVTGLAIVGSNVRLAGVRAELSSTVSVNSGDVLTARISYESFTGIPINVCCSGIIQATTNSGAPGIIGTYVARRTTVASLDISMRFDKSINANIGFKLT